MAEIFISYAREDRATAERLAQSLEPYGWSVWWDRHIPAGRRFDEVIADQLADANCVLALWSKRANQSEWVVEEAETGRERGILVPALIEAVEPPLGFRRIHAADLIGWTGTTDHAGFSQLVKDVDAVLLRRRGAAARGTTVAPLLDLRATTRPEAPPNEVSPVPAAVPPQAPRMWADPVVLQKIEQRLAQSIGPIARVIITRSSAEAADLPTLLDLLGRHVSEDAERAYFLRDCVRLAHLPKPDATPAATTAAAPVPAAVGAGRLPIAENRLCEIEMALARYIGPIAKVVVKRALAQCGSSDELCASLLTHIDREDDRRQFRAAVARIV